MRPLAMLLYAAMACGPAAAQDYEEQAAFVEANVLNIFYHELAHAVLDLMDVPTEGQDDDTADSMAVLLINAVYEEDAAQSFAYDSAFGYIREPAGVEPSGYWKTHGPDARRYLNQVCLFFGANPDERADLAAELGLPNDRADRCAADYAQTIAGWGATFERLISVSGETSLNLAEPIPNSDDDDPIRGLLAYEVAYLNERLALPRAITIRLENCGEARAFYTPEDVSITLCTEVVSYLETAFMSVPE